MENIELDRYGLVTAGENEGYFIRVHYDQKDTCGYYVFLVNDIENPSDGGDYWTRDMEELRNLFRVSGWEVRWLG